MSSLDMARPEPCDSPAFDRVVRRAAFAVLAASLLVGIYAAAELRPLFADGVYYLLRILEQDTIKSGPARYTVDAVRQLPFLAFVRLGFTDLGILAVAFGLCIQLAPTLLIAASWLALPRGRKFLFVFPLLAAVAGQEASSFAAVAEGTAATGYFWILLFAVLFARLRPLPATLLTAMAAGCFALHEGVSFLGPILAAAAFWRAWSAPTRAGKVFFAVLGAVFLAAAARQLHFVLDPTSLENRASFVTGLLRFRWLRNPGADLNLPALAGALAIPLAFLLLAFAWWRAGRWQVFAGWAALSAFAAIAGYAVVDALVEGRVFASGSQFAARNNSMLLSAPLAVAAFGFALMPRLARALALRQCLTLAAIVAATALSWHIGSIRVWSEYVEAFRELLVRHRGYVGFADAAASLSPRKSKVVRSYGHAWIEPSLSIILSPRGEIGTIVGRSWPQGWEPFDPRKPEALPRSKYWRYDAYLNALAGQRDGKARP